LQQETRGSQQLVQQLVLEQLSPQHYNLLFGNLLIFPPQLANTG